MRVLRIKLPVSNVFLVGGDGDGGRPILVDTGRPGDVPRIAERLERAGVPLQALALILLTHHHADHVGNAAELRRLAGAPLAAHPAEAPALLSGRNAPVHPRSTMGRLIQRFADYPFEPVAPDIALDDLMRLDAHGVAGTVLRTPGHTPGSVSLLLDDGQALVGDLLMGGYLGGAVASGRPGDHYFVDDAAAVRHSVARLLDHGARRFHVGHGGPVEAKDVAAWLARQAAEPVTAAPGR